MRLCRRAHQASFPRSGQSVPWAEARRVGLSGLLDAKSGRAAGQAIAEPVLVAPLLGYCITRGGVPLLLEELLTLVHLGQTGTEQRAPLLDLCLKIHEGPQNLLGPGRAAGNVNVHRHESIDSLDHGVRVEYAARRGTRAHADAPLGFGHLKPDPL